MAKYPQDEKGRYFIDKRIDGKRCHIRSNTVKGLEKKYREWVKEDHTAQKKRMRGATFDEMADEWWSITEAQIRPGTARCYKPAYNFWKSRLYGMSMSSIETCDISVCLAELSKKYTKKTCTNYRIVASLIFTYWANQHGGGANVVTNAIIPRNAIPSKKREPPTEEQLSVILNHPEGFGFAAQFFAYTGLRLAEANAVQVKDIDMDKMCYGIKGCIHITKQAGWPGNSPVVENQLKTNAGYRTIPIFAPLRPHLEDRIKDLAPDDFVLSGGAKPLTKNQFRCRWSEYLRPMGFSHPHKKKVKHGDKEWVGTDWYPDITPHQFRHFMATACYEAGVPELVAQKILGHSDIATTHRIYTHVRDRLMAESAAKLDSLFQANSPT